MGLKQGWQRSGSHDSRQKLGIAPPAAVPPVRRATVAAPPEPKVGKQPGAPPVKTGKAAAVVPGKVTGAPKVAKAPRKAASVAAVLGVLGADAVDGHRSHFGSAQSQPTQPGWCEKACRRVAATALQTVHDRCITRSKCCWMMYYNYLCSEFFSYVRWTIRCSKNITSFDIFFLNTS